MKLNSHESLERLIDLYSGDVYKIAYCYMKDWQLAEDVSQEVFYKAMKNYANFNHRSSEKTWLIRITINTCKDLLKNGWLKRVQTSVVDDGLMGQVEPPFDIIRWERDCAIDDCLQKLSDHDREVILLFYYDELTYEEISAVLGIPMGTVRSRLSRARLKLKKILNEEDELCKTGEEGELCVRGTSLAMGYYNNAEKTNAAFVQNPLNRSYPELIYRTGDIVCRDENALIQFRGRKDSLVKHMGYRIELGEIEHVIINELGLVKYCCAVYQFDKKEIIL